MSDLNLPEGFAELSPEKQKEIRDTGEQLVRFAYDHTFPITIAPPPETGTADEFHNGSGFFVRIGNRLFLATADHVLDYYLSHRKDDARSLVFQAAQFRIWPEERPIWRNKDQDVALIEVQEAEAARINVLIVDPPRGWPPPAPKVGSYVMFSGFPAVVRERLSERHTQFNAMSSLMQVTSAGDGYIVLQFDRDEWVNFGPAAIPEIGTALGGMSGGPVFGNGIIALPLVGLISEFSENLELMYIRTLECVPIDVPTVVLEPSSHAT